MVDPITDTGVLCIVSGPLRRGRAVWIAGWILTICYLHKVGCKARTQLFVMGYMVVKAYICDIAFYHCHLIRFPIAMVIHFSW